jgi:hypothetical protein
MPPLSPKIKIFGDPNANFAVQRYAKILIYANFGAWKTTFFLYLSKITQNVPQKMSGSDPDARDKELLK